MKASQRWKNKLKKTILYGAKKKTSKKKDPQ